MKTTFVLFMHKVSFLNKERPFKNLLDEKVKSYFAENDIKDKGNWKLFHKTIVLFVLLIVCYVLILTVFKNSWWAIALFSALAFIKSSIGFNVMHDAAHGSYSKNKGLNNALSFFGGDLLGISTFFWKIKHNIIHHTYTNIDGIDDDIAKYPYYRFSPEQKPLWFHKYQHIYGIPLYGLLSINWIIADDYMKLFKKQIHTTPITTIKNKDRFTFFFGKLLNLSIFLFIPLMVMPWSIAIVSYITMHIVLGITIALVFQMAHVVEHVDFPMPNEVTNKIENEWMIHQIDTTANFAMNNKFISWFVGGLNYQVEHHLYPRISHIHYPKISEFVQQTCKELGVEYNAFPTFWKAFVSHMKFLKYLGTAPAS